MMIPKTINLNKISLIRELSRNRGNYGSQVTPFHLKSRSYTWISYGLIRWFMGMSENIDFIRVSGAGGSLLAKNLSGSRRLDLFLFLNFFSGVRYGRFRTFIDNYVDNFGHLRYLRRPF